MLATAERKTARAGADNPPEPRATAKISETEGEVIALFVQLARMIGLPRSYAEIYGLLFVCPNPLALDDLIARLGISKGSASQGLKFLRGAGAVREVYVPGERRVHYEAVAQLRYLVTRFLHERVVPHLDTGLERIEHIKKQVKDLPPGQRAHLQARLTMLHSWEKKSRRFLVIVTKLLGS